MAPRREDSRRGWAEAKNAEQVLATRDRDLPCRRAAKKRRLAGLRSYLCRFATSTTCVSPSDGRLMRGSARCTAYPTIDFLVIRENTFFLFSVGTSSPRLTKVCGSFDRSETLDEPASIALGTLKMATDRKGGFEIWTSQWGFFEPFVSDLSKDVLACDAADDQYERLSIDLVPAFHQKSVSVTWHARCVFHGGD